jgi:hypothetical protein
MPRYFFHLENSSSPAQDIEGKELPDLEAAKCHAVTLIAEALCEHPKGFWDADTYQITVSNENGLNLFMICMMSVIAPAASAG